MCRGEERRVGSGVGCGMCRSSAALRGLREGQPKQIAANEHAFQQGSFGGGFLPGETLTDEMRGTCWDLTNMFLYNFFKYIYIFHKPGEIAAIMLAM